METVSALLDGHLCGEFTGFPHKGQWRRALMYSLICARINGWVNNREAGDLRRHPTHCDVIVMICFYFSMNSSWTSPTGNRSVSHLLGCSTSPARETDHHHAIPCCSFGARLTSSLWLSPTTLHSLLYIYLLQKSQPPTSHHLFMNKYSWSQL